MLISNNCFNISHSIIKSAIIGSKKMTAIKCQASNKKKVDFAQVEMMRFFKGIFPTLYHKG